MLFYNCNIKLKYEKSKLEKNIKWNQYEGECNTEV